MSQPVSHQDHSRSKVGLTAHLVASARAAEHSRPDGLIKDPYACLFSSTVEMHDQLREQGFKISDDPNSEGNKGGIDGIAVRTRKIDDELLRFTTENPKSQLCALGAGLDTRAWRLNFETQNIDTSVIPYFELDFAEIFEYKLPVLESAGATSAFSYTNVSADLSLPGWTDKLVAAGFNALLPTFWLLEGFTGYLTEAEFHALFDTLTDLSAPRSRLVATFLTPQPTSTTVLHRFKPAVPIDEVTKHAGWAGVQEDISDLGLLYQRPLTTDRMKGYKIVVADYTK